MSSTRNPTRALLHWINWCRNIQPATTSMKCSSARRAAVFRQSVPQVAGGYEAVIKIGATSAFYNQACTSMLVAVQAGRERGQSGFVRRVLDSGAAFEARFRTNVDIDP